jgi:uncharacterized membrane-anchored protein YhcB (DUF1043 family)
MKKTFIQLVIPVFIAGTILFSCQSPRQKQEATQLKVQEARKDLNSAKKDANEAAMVVATAEEWNTFKSESELKINENEIRIKELKLKLNKPGEILDPHYSKRIADLEQQNKDLRAKLYSYEKSQSNWESFKREFNSDMNSFGEAFKNLTVDNKK